MRRKNKKFSENADSEIFRKWEVQNFRKCFRAFTNDAWSIRYIGWQFRYQYYVIYFCAYISFKVTIHSLPYVSLRYHSKFKVKSVIFLLFRSGCMFICVRIYFCGKSLFQRQLHSLLLQIYLIDLFILYENVASSWRKP